jgi:hypothetical protein
MNEDSRDERYKKARKVVILFCAWGGAGGFWAAVFAGLARYFFGLDENTALLWVGLPVLILFIPFTIFVLPKHLHKAGLF